MTTINTTILDMLMTVINNENKDYSNAELDNSIHQDGPSGDRYEELMAVGNLPHVQDGSRVKELANLRFVEQVTGKPGLITLDILKEIDDIIDMYLPKQDR